MKITEIGEVQSAEDGFAIQLKEEYREALTGIEGFSYLDIIWWANLTDTPDYRGILITDKPYKKGPEKLGIFATRSQIRPNPIAVTPVYVLSVNRDTGTVYTPYIDAEIGTPVLDIKPYHPCTDIVQNVSVPSWCEHWPKSVEESGEFNWEAEFNFPA
ncbi:MAG: SAM-dependent methyltransferase [Spirochaetes bacterium]|nr:SAM-dependent methyltransferase [Spirochaetota bacterium]MBN2769451.1 SAM-dependent methyltransferase [Spirochaetota bacterium]